MQISRLRKLAGLPLMEAVSSQQEANRIAKLVKDSFHVQVDVTSNDDGSFTLKCNDGYFADSKETNPHAFTSKNLSKVLDKDFAEFRKKGWVFTQPVSGEFRIKVTS